jgi:hypothetical protein
MRSISSCVAFAYWALARCLGFELDGFTLKPVCGLYLSLCLFFKRSNGFAREFRRLCLVGFLCLGTDPAQDFSVSPSRDFFNGLDRVTRTLQRTSLV